MRRAPGFVVRSAAALSLAVLASHGAARAEEVHAAPAAHDAPPAGATREEVVPFTRLGAYEPIKLRGLKAETALGFGLRLDEQVMRARLRLHMTYSPALLFELSHLKVFLNDELVATVPLTKEGAGSPVEREVELPTRLLADFDRLRFELVAHYSKECEDPFHSSLWADLSPKSELVLTTATRALANDLALLPAPFFDRHDGRRATVPLILPAKPAVEVQHAAGVVASWLGALAGYRGARFPVSFDASPREHAILFATPKDRPAGLDVPNVDGPTLALVDHPAAPGKKVLLVLGRDAREIDVAATALVLGKAVLAGATAKVGVVDPGPRRQPWDGPAFVPTDRPVRLGELVGGPEALEVRGALPDPIRVYFRVPADLDGWQEAGIPLHLQFGYTPPRTTDDSTLNVEVDQTLVESIRLVGEPPPVAPPPVDPNAKHAMDTTLRVKTLHVGGLSQLSMRFTLVPHRVDVCNLAPADNLRASIDPDSTIDLSGLEHHAIQPNLAAFASSGFPFTRYADLSETALVLPDAPAAGDLEVAFSLLGRMGYWSGLPATRFEVVPATQVGGHSSRNLLVVGTGSASAMLEKWGKSLPLVVAASRREVGKPKDAPARTTSPSPPRGLVEATPAGRALVETDGPLAAFVAFESPLLHGMTAVAVVGSGPETLPSVLDVLEDGARSLRLRGDVTVVRGADVEGFQIGPTFETTDRPAARRAAKTVAAAGWGVGIFIAVAMLGGLVTYKLRHGRKRA